jgi:hypothetical protein
MLAEAHDFHHALPADKVGMCVLDAKRRLFRGDPSDLRHALDQGEVDFHAGSIRGSLPTPVSP